MGTRPYTVGSLSFGKDSLAMCIGLSERGELDEVVFYNEGMQFDAIYREREREVGPLVRGARRQVHRA